MSRSQVTAKTVNPSVSAEGSERSRKLLLKAANDNRAPLFYTLKKSAKILLPLAGIAFFAAAWWLS
ncbi:hypothetical protein [Sneathiella glossodoripedis]|uniref:hypothetical protein n=1 Tax=Sneathiella glossodoripedis TaxID=418853 RepID=UPI0004711F1A|nr:hypothetical protein [Sneathiella glossodoripedis]